MPWRTIQADEKTVALGDHLRRPATSKNRNNLGNQSPDNSQVLAATLPMTDRGVATSGDYQRYFDHGGRRYHHLINPETGAPSLVDLRSVTVAAESCEAADAAATTAFVSSVSDASKVMTRLAPGSEVVHTV